MSRLTETKLNERLDHDGLHDTARRPGVYVLELREPSSDRAMLLVEWQGEFDAPPPNGFLDRLAGSERFVYVGSHGKNVYTRLCQHANGEKSSTIMQVWEPVDVVGVWPEEYPDAEEWNRAVAIASEDICVWSDGSFI